MSAHKKGGYYLPEPSHWPIIGSIGIFCFLTGFANWLHQNTIGPILFFLGAIIIAYMLFGWFGTVIKENQAGLLDNEQIERSFRWAMVWFIFSEVMFFGGFFGALFYARVLSVPWLGGEGMHTITHVLLWPNFVATWPLHTTPDPSQFTGPREVINTWGLPALNTLILLSSGVTITIAHWAMLNDNRRMQIIGQLFTVLLGILFLCMQAVEYGEAYTEKGLKLSAGIYGTTFFMLTGFHAAHVTLGTIMLIVILYRIYRGHFTANHHFAFEAVSWYWHFVDVVWLILFVFVYWI
ncbi:MAG: cytochrome c oxidase subunit 3 [Coxiellaceae bacterium]|nr:cytochrome c oxidase subunit 3 [Coxiellaceae bacterium]